MDAVILAGGFGKRLEEVGLKVPKPLAPINGTPFLEILLRRLEGNVDRVILAIGYQGEKIREFCSNNHYRFEISFSEETIPLGTGGALKRALEYALSEDVLVMNGDTYLNIDYKKLFEFHKKKEGVATLVCLPQLSEKRYGAITLNENDQIITFAEKNEGQWINGGVYVVKKNVLEGFRKEVFSLEIDAFPALLKEKIFGFSCSPFFIDIGTKNSYFEAQKCLKNMC